MKSTSNILIIASVFLLASCSSIQPSTLEKAHKKIDTVRVISIIDQPSLTIQYNRSSAAPILWATVGITGGVLAQAVDTAINSVRVTNAMDKLAPIQASLIERDINGMLHNSLQEAIESIEWADANFIRHQADKHPRMSRTLIDMEEDALLVLQTSYSLTPELESLEVTTKFAVYIDKYKDKPRRTRKQLLRNINPIYRGGVKFQSKLRGGRHRSLVGLSTEGKQRAITEHYERKLSTRSGKSNRYTLEEEMKRKLKRPEKHFFLKIDGEVDVHGSGWLENEAQLINETMDLAIVEIGELLAMHLNTSYATHASNLKTEFPAAHIRGWNKTSLHKTSAKGWLIDETESRKRIRLTDDVMYSVSHDDFIRPVLFEERASTGSPPLERKTQEQLQKARAEQSGKE